MKKITTIFGVLLLIFQLNVMAQTQIGQTVVGPIAGDYQGITDLNSDGSRMIAGAVQWGGTSDGYARVFEFDGTDWVQMGTDLLPENAGDELGWNVAMNGIGDIVAVYASRNDGNGTDAGSARVYQFVGNDWVQMGDDIDGAAAGDGDGWGDIDLSSDGTILAMGGPYNDGGAADAGHVRVFEFDGTDWIQQGNAIEGEAAGARAGFRVSLNNAGSRVTLGSQYIDTANGFQTGKCSIYEFDGTNWVQLGQDINGEADFDRSGKDAVLNGDGSIVAISAPANNGDGGNDRGSIRVFQFDGTNWVQLGQDIDGDQDGAVGFEVSINGDGTVVSSGAHFYDTSGENRGVARIYKYDGSEWIQRGIDIEGLAADAHEAWSTNLSEDGNILLTGAYGTSSFRGSVRVFDLSNILSIDSISNELGIVLYPNPASNVVTIDGNFTELQVSIYDMLGKEITYQKVKNQLDVSFLQSGNYLVRLTDGEKSTTHKLIKN